eukprot:2330951-Rhodomonas_salina.1
MMKEGPVESPIATSFHIRGRVAVQAQQVKSIQVRMSRLEVIPACAFQCDSIWFACDRRQPGRY